MDTRFPSKPILIVDDEPAAVTGASLILEADGVDNVVCLTDSRDVLRTLEQQSFSLVLLDLSMPHVCGETLLERITEDHPGLPVMVVTGQNELETAIRCMKKGAFDYLTKPVEPTRLIAAVRRAVELFQLRFEYASFRARVLGDAPLHAEAFSRFVTRSAKVHTLFHYIETIAATSRPVLVTGETGVGKELVAEILYELSGQTGAFVPVNVAGLDDTVFSDTLFGHLKGAFTDAATPRKGLVEKAAGGTLFLDEIGDLHPRSQVKLLRLIQEGEYYPLGADAAKPAEARIIAATNKTTKELQESDAFRKDLYFRLQTHHVHIPALRERPEDIPLLLEHFLEKAAEALDKKVPTYPKELPTLLAAYPFPGNVRELEAMVFDAVSGHTERMLSMSVFKAHMERHRDSGGAVDTSDSQREKGASPFAFVGTLPTLTEGQALLIEEAMKRAGGNQTMAAGMLGITRSGLSKAIKRKNISKGGSDKNG